jgi:hypothetical protein
VYEWFGLMKTPWGSGVCVGFGVLVGVTVGSGRGFSNSGINTFGKVFDDEVGFVVGDGVFVGDGG